jgi:hypothetical protein
VSPRFELDDPEGTIERELAEGLPQREIAKTYALALRKQGDVDWPRINRAIIERWSRTGLERIKKLAWSGRAFDPAPVDGTTPPGLE